MSRRCPSALLPSLLLALLAPLFARTTSAFEPEVPAAVDPSFGPRIAEAVAEAAERLDAAPCALVLSDFVDSRTGLTLAENLAATGRTASEHVASLLFRGAPSLKPFPGRQVFAFTVPASPVVFLCRDDLLRVQNQRRFVTAIVIHEVLHTLGLREDLPSSLAITERVLERCF
jgi:hypothetical protein